MYLSFVFFNFVLPHGVIKNDIILSARDPFYITAACRFPYACAHTGAHVVVVGTSKLVPSCHGTRRPAGCLPWSSTWRRHFTDARQRQRRHQSITRNSKTSTLADRPWVAPTASASGISRRSYYQRLLYWLRLPYVCIQSPAMLQYWIWSVANCMFFCIFYVLFLLHSAEIVRRSELWKSVKATDIFIPLDKVNLVPTPHNLVVTPAYYRSGSLLMLI